MKAKTKPTGNKPDDKTTNTVDEFSIRISKRLDDDGEHITGKISINQEFGNLIRNFAVLDEKMDFLYGNATYKRYKIKRVLKNSATFSNEFDFFFTPDLLDNREVEVKFTSLTAFQNFTNALKNVRNFISTMLNLLNLGNDINITISQAGKKTKKSQEQETGVLTHEAIIERLNNARQNAISGEENLCTHKGGDGEWNYVCEQHECEDGVTEERYLCGNCREEITHLIFPEGEEE